MGQGKLKKEKGTRNPNFVCRTQIEEAGYRAMEKCGLYSED